MVAKDSEYSQEWRDGIIQRACYERAGWRCEHCGMEFVEGTTQAKTERRKDGKPFSLTVHHLNGDKNDYRHENLLTCCQRCHLSIQGKWKPGHVLPADWQAAPAWLIERGLPFEILSQMALF